MDIKKYDYIIIGAGSGLTISATMAAQGKKVAVVEKGPFGGTCLNRGCIPSKMLIHAADVVKEIQEASKLGIDAEYKGIDFQALVKRVSGTVDKDAKNILEANIRDKNITVYEGQAVFLDKKVIEVEGHQITADNIIIAAGTRSFIPPIKGLGEVPYITSTEALRLTKLPKSMIIIGGGYISAELSHFYGTLGTEITIIERGEKLLGREDHEVSSAFTNVMKDRFTVVLDSNAIEVTNSDKGISVKAENIKTGMKSTHQAEQLLVVVGRRPNTDLLELKEAGYELTERGYLNVNECLETNVPGVYALGDIAGKWFFKHSANYEAEVILRNFFLKEREKADYTAMPHAVFTYPQVAGVGKKEQELKEEGIKYKSARYNLKDTGMGMALLDEHSFVKVLSDEKGEKILGCHIFGHEASTLIHEVLPIMRMGGSVDDILKTIHVHPALPEFIQRGFASL